MKSIKSLVIAGALQALVVLPGLAGETLDAIKAAGAFRIGTEGTYPPLAGDAVGGGSSNAWRSPGRSHAALRAEAGGSGAAATTGSDAQD